MLRFDLSQLTDGRAVATCEARTATGQDPCRSIARDLVEAGVEDQPWEMWRDSMRCMTGKSLHWLAATAIRENDTGLNLGWWGLHPQAAPRPVLTNLVERLKAETAARKPTPKKAVAQKAPRRSPRTAPRGLR